MRSRRKWLRGKDSNQRPPGYEPDELPTALPRDEMMLIDNTTRRRLCQAFFILCRTETILTRLRTILFGAFPRLRLANMYTIACVSSAKNHPKISCSEVQAVRRRRTWFVLFRSGMLPETKRICLGTIPFGAFPRPNFRTRYYRLRSDIPCGSTQNGRGSKSGSRSPSGLAGTAPRRRAFSSP